MIHVILADAEIELIRIGTRDEVLDAREHRNLVAGRPYANRRGRPDIVHDSLMLLLSSEHFQHGELSARVLTVEDEVLTFDEGSIVPEDFAAFKEALAALLSSRANRNELGWTMEAGCPLEKLVEDIGADAIILLSPRGQIIPLRALLNELHHLDLVIIIGAFPEGDFRSDAYAIAHHVVSLGEEEMTVPSVIRELLGAIEH